MALDDWRHDLLTPVRPVQIVPFKPLPQGPPPILRRTDLSGEVWSNVVVVMVVWPTPNVEEDRRKRRYSCLLTCDTS